MEQTKLSDSVRQVWFDGRTIPLENQTLWSLLSNSCLDKIVVSPDQYRAGHFPRKTELIIAAAGLGDLADIPPESIVLSEDESLLEQAKGKGCRTCISFNVQGRVELEHSWQAAAKYDFAVIDFDLPTNIPLELILARLQNRSTVILKRERTLAGLEVAFGVMEQGSDGVLLVCSDPAEISKVSSFLALSQTTRVELQTLTVREIRHIGMGARACIDTTGLMTTSEGMLIGSTSLGGIFVCSETHFLPYMNLRPFRVNAGAVHSYVWMPNDTAEYLTDLRAGSKVLCVNTNGEVRELTVGRVKIEVRPLLLIVGTVGGQEINVIVQDDWHIRLMGADGQPRNATDLQAGDCLLAYLSKPGRHVGIKVAETIIEK